MTYEEYKRDIAAKRIELRGFMVNPSEKPQPATEFIENSAKTAKVVLSGHKTAKITENLPKLRRISPKEHLQALQTLQTPEEMSKVWREKYCESPREPNAAFRRKKKEMACEHMDTEEPNEDRHLTAARAIIDELEDFDDMMDEWDGDEDEQDDDRWYPSDIKPI